jgi:hypothetical protein
LVVGVRSRPCGMAAATACFMASLYFWDNAFRGLGWTYRR